MYGVVDVIGIEVVVEWRGTRWPPAFEWRLGLVIVSWLLIECVSCLMFSVQCSMFNVCCLHVSFYNKHEIVFVRIFGAFSFLFCSVLSKWSFLLLHRWIDR